MSNREQKKVNISVLMIWIVLILAIIIVIAISNAIKKSNNIEYQGDVVGNIEVDLGKEIQKNEEDAELARIKKMTERARIEYYATQFINYVEAEEYAKAYELLNSTYKDNYFPNINKFKEYAQNNFSKMMNVEYTNFERSADVYVIWLTITDAINGTPNSGKEMNFVIKENNYNDFELSFSAN